MKLKLILLLLVFAALFTSCKQEGKSTKNTENPDVAKIKDPTSILE